MLKVGPEDAALPLHWGAALRLVATAVPAAVPPPRAAEAPVTRGDLAVWLGQLLREAVERGALDL